MHTEWDTATSCDYVALPTSRADEDLGLYPDEPYSAPAVLVLGGAGGGCLAIEGTKEDLIEFAEAVLRQVRELPDNLPEVPEEGDDEPDDSQINPY
jgi:hypothetical protein